MVVEREFIVERPTGTFEGMRVSLGRSLGRRVAAHWVVFRRDGRPAHEYGVGRIHRSGARCVGMGG